MLGTRLTTAALTARHENQVRRHCEPVACDVASHALLYDLDACAAVLDPLGRRVQLTQRA